MRREDATGDGRWHAAALAKPIAPVSPDVTCSDVYGMMTADEALFAMAVVADDTPLGLVDRVSLMTNFARQYWRELFAHRPITKFMDADPLAVDAELPIEAISLRIATIKRSALNSGFIVLRNSRYLGVGNSIDLLKLVADRAQERAQALADAHREIRAFNEELEGRVEQRTAELHAAQQELVRKERLSVLGQLTATVAHELRNPLSSIRNTVFTMKESTARVAPQLERPLARIERSVVRCDRIIDDLLDYTRLRALQRTTVAADQWLGEILDEQPVPHNVRLVRRFEASSYSVLLDADRMRRVIINLVENASQALMEAEAFGCERLIVVTTRAANAGYELTIEDNGPGIPADVLPKVFEPLFSTKSFGTGLGLPTVKQIVEQHAGEITIASEVGNGTRVTIHLPNAAREEIAA